MGLSDGTETAIRQKKKGARADKRHRHPEFTILELREPKASGSSFFVKKAFAKNRGIYNIDTPVFGSLFGCQSRGCGTGPQDSALVMTI